MLLWVTIAILAAPTTSTAQDPPITQATATQGEDASAPELPAVRPWRRAGAIGASIVPGVLVHGAGHMALGEWRTGLWLLGMQGLGLAGFVGGISGLAITGASDEFTPPAIWLTAAGFGLFAGSFAADVYGVLGLADNTRPRLDAAPIEVRQSYQFVTNPVLPETHFSHTALRWRPGRWSVEPDMWVHLGGEDLRSALRVGWRLAGGEAAAIEDDALDLVGGYVLHRRGADGTTSHLGEVLVRGRLGLGRFAPTLRGSFLTGSAGIGAGGISYDAVEGSDPQSVLLGTLGLGVLLGRTPGSWGQAMLYYDHRHDSYVAGLKMRGLGSGAAGHFGAALERQIWGAWGISARAAFGSSVMGRLGILYRPTTQG